MKQRSRFGVAAGGLMALALVFAGCADSRGLPLMWDAAGPGSGETGGSGGTGGSVGTGGIPGLRDGGIILPPGLIPDGGITLPPGLITDAGLNVDMNIINWGGLQDASVPDGASNPICPGNVRSAQCQGTTAGGQGQICLLPKATGICTCMLGRWLCPETGDAGGPALCPSNAATGAACTSLGILCMSGRTACVCGLGTYMCL